jgi:hypothetical protein
VSNKTHIPRSTKHVPYISVLKSLYFSEFFFRENTAIPKSRASNSPSFTSKHCRRVSRRRDYMRTQLRHERSSCSSSSSVNWEEFELVSRRGRIENTPGVQRLANSPNNNTHTHSTHNNARVLRTWAFAVAHKSSHTQHTHTHARQRQRGQGKRHTRARHAARHTHRFVSALTHLSKQVCYVHSRFARLEYR